MAAHTRKHTHTHTMTYGQNKIMLLVNVFMSAPPVRSLSLSLPLTLPLCRSIYASLSPCLSPWPPTVCLWVLKLHEIRNLLLWHTVCKEQCRSEGERKRGSEGARERARQLRGQALMTSRCGLRACGAKIACFPI